MKTIEVRDIDELGVAAKVLVHFFDSVRLVILHGRMGAGKTTLVKSMLSELSAIDQGNSPTFSLINVYQGKTGEKIYHLDLYRLTNLEEALDIGVEDVIYDNCWRFIEWPEHIISLLPRPYGEVNIELEEDHLRRIHYSITE
jgi:tRNA threonylcarbamoyladenosine biosynthesis protein TsaE